MEYNFKKIRNKIHFLVSIFFKWLTENKSLNLKFDGKKSINNKVRILNNVAFTTISTKKYNKHILKNKSRSLKAQSITKRSYLIIVTKLRTFDMKLIKQ